MKTSDFDYDLPAALVAQTPAAKRDASRLLVFHKGTRAVEDAGFSDLPAVVRALREATGARKVLFVANDSRVYPARVRVTRVSGARGEVFLLRVEGQGPYECLLRPLKKLRVGETLHLEAGGEPAFRVESLDPPLVSVEGGGAVLPFLEAHGEMPLPPYIERDPKKAADTRAAAGGTASRFADLDAERYQTVYAGTAVGSAAAPTAGLHFTPAIMDACRAEGAEFRYVTLHVGLGTFAPVQAGDPADHEMHEEWCVVPANVASALREARHEAARGETGTIVVFVGTTSMRTVESWFRSGAPEDTWFPTKLFVYPGAPDAVPPEAGPSAPLTVGDAILTNFHQPGSTLVMLVAALAGERAWRPLYEHAIAQRYRFLSYGDSGLLLFSRRLSSVTLPLASPRHGARNLGGRA